MLELFDWNVGMSGLAVILLVAGALLLGGVPQFVGDPKTGYEWLVSAAAVLVGGWLGSEAFGSVSTFGPAFEGLYIVTALVGGIVLGVVVDAVLRYATGGSYTQAPHAA